MISPNWWIVAIVLSAIVVGVVAVLRIDRAGEQGSGLGERFDYQIEPYRKVDPALVHYHQTGQIPTQMHQARAVAVGPQDRVYVAGVDAVHVFDASGALRGRIAFSGEPTCLAVGGSEHAFPARVYVGVGRNIQTFDTQGNPSGTWNLPGEKVRLTSIALAKDDVFVADYANRVVLRLDTSGKLLGRIGQRDRQRGVPGFVIPSPFFDLAVAPDGHLWVVNPGATRLEAYTFEGRLELFWGEGTTSDIEGFFGCCNPAHFAILPDGRFVTAEKGLVRVKVYTADGRFQSVVAGPEQLDPPRRAVRGSSDPAPARAASRLDREFKAVDVAADRKGRILILDLSGRIVRVYEPKQDVSQAQ